MDEKKEIKHTNNTLFIPKQQLKFLEESLKYNFKDKELLRHALQHSSIKLSAIPFE